MLSTKWILEVENFAKENKMSKPFFIWTMRRTGGTSLTDLLTDISEYRGIEHEPFNADKKLGRFIKSFQNGTKCEKIIKELDEIFLAKPLIKHCYEIFGKEFNSLLVQSIVKHDYKHLFLKREDEISRIISLYLAQQTSVWGPEQKKKKYDDIISGKDKLEPFSIEKMIDDYKWCRNITNQTQKMLTEKGKEFMLISFEDFYVGERDRRLENLYST